MALELWWSLIFEYFDFGLERGRGADWLIR